MLSGGDSKKDGRAEPKAKERAEAELRNPRQRMEEGLRFFAAEADARQITNPS